MDAGLPGGGFGVLSLVAMGFGCSSIVLCILFWEFVLGIWFFAVLCFLEYQQFKVVMKNNGKMIKTEYVRF